MSGLGKQRLEALVDGIFAVAMMLLVLDIKLPDIDRGATFFAIVPLASVPTPGGTCTAGDQAADSCTSVCSKRKVQGAAAASGALAA